MRRTIFYVGLSSLIAISAHGQEVNLPDQESEFCSIVENATFEYKSLANDRSTADKQQNGIRVEQIERQMTSVYTRRNESVYRLFRKGRFLLNNWVVSISKINSPISDCHTNMPSCIFVDVHSPCSPVTILHAITLTTPMQLQFLGGKQRGDQLIMSGTIVAKFGGATAAASPVLPASPDDLEGSFRESGSMKEPEYSVDVRQWR